MYETRTPELLEAALAALPPATHDAVVVFGSAALILHDVAIRRPVGGLDLWVSPETFASLRDGGMQLDAAEDGPERLIAAPDVFVYPGVPGLGFNKVHADSAQRPRSAGLRVMPLAHLASWKLAQDRGRGAAAVAKRDVDLSDLAAIPPAALKFTMVRPPAKEILAADATSGERMRLASPREGAFGFAFQGYHRAGRSAPSIAGLRLLSSAQQASVMMAWYEHEYSEAAKSGFW